MFYINKLTILIYLKNFSCYIYNIFNIILSLNIFIIFLYFFINYKFYKFYIFLEIIHSQFIYLGKMFP